MIGYIGWAGVVLLAIYELVGIINPRVPTISEIVWRLMEKKTFRAAFFFTWAWLTFHFFAPDFFR